MSGRYTSNSVKAARPVYVAVNVYRAKDGWYVVTRIMRAGGRAPQTIRLVDKRILAASAQTIPDALTVAAAALADLAAHYSDQ